MLSLSRGRRRIRLRVTLPSDCMAGFLTAGRLAASFLRAAQARTS
jgi:hypothetical protein